MLTMGGAGAQRELFKAIVDHCRPMIEKNELTLFVNLGDHTDNWDVAQGRAWGRCIGRTDPLRSGQTPRRSRTRFVMATASGLHVFLFDNTFHGVYASELSDAGERCDDHQAVGIGVLSDPQDL